MTRHEQGSEWGEWEALQPLLWPLRLGDLELPNRVVMAPLTRATNPQLVPTDLHAVYYGQRASAGLIVAEATWVSEEAIGFVDVPGIYSEQQVVAWRRVTDLVHALGGRIVVQLWHAGANSHPDHRRGARPAGPSAIDPGERCLTRTGPKATVTPREMTVTEIEATVTAYRAAAANARRAGFDGVEIAANGTYLIAQFLNPRLNRRTDRYGTDRTRLALEIVDAVTDEWDGRRVGVRLSPYWSVRDRSAADPPHDCYPYTADDETLAIHDELVSELDRRPLAYLHVRGPAPRTQGVGPDVDAIARYRKRFAGPLIANHGFDRTTANAVVEGGAADAVSFAGLFVANPDLVSRFAFDHELATSDRRTHYGGGAHGYVDYPIWSAS